MNNYIIKWADRYAGVKSMPFDTEHPHTTCIGADSEKTARRALMKLYPWLDKKIVEIQEVSDEELTGKYDLKRQCPIYLDSDD